MQNKHININILLDTLNKDKEIMLKNIRNSKDNSRIEYLNGYISGINFCKETIKELIKEESNNV